MFSLLIGVHVVTSFLMILFVLLQSDKGAELGAAFGGAGQANSLRTPMTGMGKITTVLAIVFMMTSLSLAYLSSEKAKDSVVRGMEALPSAPIEQAIDPIPEPEAVPEKLPAIQLEQSEAPPVKPSEMPPAAPENTQ